MLRGQLTGRPANCTANTVYVHQHVTGTEHSCHYRQLLAQRPADTFKCLIALLPGVNQLLLRCCRAELCLSITHTPAWTPDDDAHIVRLLFVQSADSADDDDASVEGTVQRITLAVQLAQSLFAEKLPARRTFRLPPNDACRPHRSRLTGDQLRQLSDAELWSSLAADAIRLQHSEQQASAGRGAHRKYVAVVSARPTLSGLGGGDLCVLGVTDVRKWPARLDDVPSALCRAAADAPVRRSMGGCSGGAGVSNSYATAIGALVHEMAHMFGAGHTHAGLMGGGVDYVARVFCCDVRTVWAPERRVAALDEAAAVMAPADKAAGRLTAVRRPSDTGGRLQRFREQQAADDDRTWFEPCSAAVLATSRWLRIESCGESCERLDGALSMDWTPAGGTVRSDGPAAPLRVVEVRRAADAMMLLWWQFERSEEMRAFGVPFDRIGGADGVEAMSAVEVFAMDCAGNQRVFRATSDDGKRNSH